MELAWSQVALFAGLGLVAGTLGGWLGIGGGALMVPILILVARLDTKIAIAASLAAMIPITVASTLQHYRGGKTVWMIIIPMAIGGLAGGLIGPLLLDVVSVNWTKRALSVFWVYAAARLWMTTM
jgi:uncharacterized membrane protein YfcA